MSCPLLLNSSEVAELAARETELRSSLAEVEAEVEMMGHTNDVGVESVAALQGELSEAQRAAAAAHSEHEHRVVGLAEEHRSQMESLHASEVALSASHDDAMQLLRTESMAALETVRAEQNEALDGAEVAVQPSSSISSGSRGQLQPSYHRERRSSPYSRK